MTAFTQTLTVRMYDTDAAGILYFGNQFRFVHDTFEAMMETKGWNFQRLFDVEPFIFVIAHAESDYLGAMHVGDKITVTGSVSHIGTTSFSLVYEIHKMGILVGRAKTVHVCLDKVSRTKITIPESFKSVLVDYLP